MIRARDEHNGAEQYEGPESGEFYKRVERRIQPDMAKIWVEDLSLCSIGSRWPVTIRLPMTRRTVPARNRTTAYMTAFQGT